MIEDIQYGRVKWIGLTLHQKRRKDPTRVSVSFWLARWKPNYAEGKHLSYMVGDIPHEIYNPLGFAFDVNLLLSHIQTLQRQIDSIDPTHFSIKEGT